MALAYRAWEVLGVLPVGAAPLAALITPAGVLDVNMTDAARIQSTAEAVMRALIRAGIGADVDLCIRTLGVVVGSLALASDVPDAAMRQFNETVRRVIEGASGE